MRYLLWFLLSCMISGCGTPIRLDVQTDYISYENLASFHVSTPDPRLLFPDIGQRLIVTWSLNNRILQSDNLHLQLTVRFRNREQQVIEIPVNACSGTYIFKILNEDYCRTQGILTYRLELIGNGMILKEWRHQLWMELIELKAE